MQLGAALLATAMMAGVEAPASACAPLANLPYSNILEEQQWVWGNADVVAVVRLVEIHKPDPSLSIRELREQRSNGTLNVGVTLEPVRWLKGSSLPTRFRMPKGGTGDCIPTSGWDASDAKVGDSFVAYFRPGPLSGDTLLGGLVPEAIRDPDVFALLMKTEE